MEKTTRVKVTKAGTLNVFDFIKGAIIAGLSSGITVVIESLDKGELFVNWKIFTTVAISSFLGYILKNLSTSSIKEVK